MKIFGKAIILYQIEQIWDIFPTLLISSNFEVFQAIYYAHQALSWCEEIDIFGCFKLDFIQIKNCCQQNVQFEFFLGK